MKKLLAAVAISLFMLNAGGTLGASDVFTFRADSITGTRSMGREVTILSGNAEVRSDTMLLRADRIEIHGENNRFIYCIGNVWGFEEDRNIIFTTDILRHDRILQITRMEGNSTLEDRENEIVARARFIEYDDENEVAIFQIGVRLFADDMVCRSEHAVYNRRTQILDLSGFPTVFMGDDEFRSDRIRVDLNTNDVVMEGGATGIIRN
ncbi:MAG: hypothetical protein FWG66_00945 [Spirochaetes bacterium]|nr:hypothetical protein [Spirochaetota bacterium]